jgi:hypothetical protein
MAPTTSNDDGNGNYDINWRLVGAGKSNTLMHKGYQYVHGAPIASSGGGPSEKIVVKTMNADSRQH